MNKKRIALIVIVIIVIAIIYLTLPKQESKEGVGLNNPDLMTDSTDANADQSQNVGVDEGDVAPTFTLETFDGEKINTADFEGRAIFIDYWANWCPFCHEEVPEIIRIRSEYAEEDLTILGIHRTATESIQAGKQFVERKNVNYTILSDPNDEVYMTFTKGRNIMPYALFIDRNGRITKILAGPKTYDQMRSEIESLFEK